MAVPKRKTSKARRDKRRASTWKLDAPAMTICPKCSEYILRHRVCRSCGTYKGELIIKPKPEKKEA